MDDEKLTQLFRQAKAADRMRVPAMSAIIARVEYAKELQARRRYQRVVELLSWVVGASTMALILLSPRGLPIPISSWIVPVLLLGVVVIHWGVGDAQLPRRAAAGKPSAI